jgi:hypothetical protein
MTFQQKFLIVVLLSTVVALGLAMRLPSTSATPPSGRFGVLPSLAAVVVALLLVGLVSHTFIRHVIQIAPLVLALALGAYRPRLRAAAALPLFTFWLFVMGGIWLFLLGIAPVFTGRFPPVEIVLTIVIGIASAVGLVAVYREGTALAVGPRVGAIMAFAILQPIAMIFSF